MQAINRSDNESTDIFSGNTLIKAKRRMSILLLTDQFTLTIAGGFATEMFRLFDLLKILSQQRGVDRESPRYNDSTWRASNPKPTLTTPHYYSKT
jgi:hypothetical protein